MKTTHWEPRLRGNNPKHIDIMNVGAADSSGAIARVPIRDGYMKSCQRTAALIAKAPELLAALLALVEEQQPLGIERAAYQTANALIIEIEDME